MKEEKNKNQEQDGKRGDNSGHVERNDIVFEEKLRLLLEEVSKHKIILFTTKRTKEKLEWDLELSIKNTDDVFEDVARLGGEVRKLKPEAAQSCKNRDNALIKAHQTLTKLK